MIENYTKSTQEIINKLSNKSVKTYIQMYGFSKSDVTAITHIESGINNLFHFDIVMHDHPGYLKIRQKLLTIVLESFIPIHASPNLKETIFKRFDQYASLPNEEMMWAKIANELFILNMEASLKGVMEELPPLQPKNPEVFIFQSMAFAEANSENINEMRNIKKNFGKKKDGCFIATMVYNDYNSPKVIVLRNFRDNTLMQSFLGRAFIKVYYKTSPTFVTLFKHNKSVINILKIFLDFIVKKMK